MPGIQDRGSDAGTQTDEVDGAPPPKLCKTDTKGTAQELKLVWKVKNRKDYTPCLHHPHSVKIFEDEIYVCEGLWPQSRIQVFNMLGHSTKVIGQGHVLPFDMTLTPEGHIALTDHKDRTVKVVDQEGNDVASWKSGLFDWPNGITSNGHQQYVVADWSVGKISVHDCEGQVIHSFKTSGNNDVEEMSCPEYIVVDSHDRVAFTDTFDQCAKVYSMQGQLLFKFGDQATEPQSKIKDPRGITIDQHGNFIVADWGAAKVKVYDSSGRWIQDKLCSADGVQYPWGLDVSRDDGLVISEHKLNSSPSLKHFKIL